MVAASIPQGLRVRGMGVPAQPHFPTMPDNTCTLWGYGFEIDDEGDYVQKKMSQATGTRS
ncbi:MAG TPA: oleate hydratase [Dermatophilaceae bacterium]|nr:oleate hydratase [Dermatophilaceae bacterium]